MLQKLQSQQHHSLEMQEEPIDFSITSHKKRKQSWHIPLKPQSTSSKKEPVSVNLTLSESSPLLNPVPDSIQGSSKNKDGADSGKSGSESCNNLISGERKQKSVETVEKWPQPAAAVKTSREYTGFKLNRARKTGPKKCIDHEQYGGGQEILLTGQSELTSSKRSDITAKLTNCRYLASGPDSPVYKTQNGSSFLPHSAGEYEPIESCETRGLKLTFRRRSTEKSQHNQKEKPSKTQHDIPKLIVQKCKSAHGYSLHSCTHEEHYKCGQTVSPENIEQETEILTLPISPKVSPVSQPFSKMEILRKADLPYATNNGNSCKNKQLTSSEKSGSTDREINDGSCQDGTPQYLEEDITLHFNVQRCLNQDSLKESTSSVSAHSSEDARLTALQNSSPTSISGKEVNINITVVDSNAQDRVKVLSQPQDIKEDTISYNSAEHSSINIDNVIEKQKSHSLESPRLLHMNTNCSHSRETTDTSSYKCHNATIVFNKEADNMKRTQTVREKSKTNSSKRIYRGSYDGLSCSSRRTRFCKSQSESWCQTSLTPHTFSQSKRSESAPPSTSFSVLCVPGLQTSEDSMCMNMTISNSEAVEMQNNINPYSIDKDPHDLINQPQSSPPIGSNQPSEEYSARKTPVVLLNRLPSPVIELYYMRGCTSNSYTSPNVSDSDHSQHLSENEASSGHWSACSGYDSENNVKSSGKLRFTYRKVPHRGNKLKRKLSLRKPAQYADELRDRFQENDKGDSCNSKVKRKPRLMQRRQRCGRTSKRGIRYVNDDDEYEENINEGGSDGISTLQGQYDFEDYLKPGEKKLKPYFRKKKLISEKSEVGLRYHEGFQEDNMKSSQQSLNLVDPRIKSLSAALIHACQNNQSAEKIAFRRKVISKSAVKNECLKQKKKFSSHQNLKKTCRVADNIRKHFSRGAVISATKNKCKLSLKKNSDKIIDVQRGPKFIKGGIAYSNKEVMERSKPKPNLSDIKHPMLLSENESQNVRPTSSDASPNRYRNVFESDVFNLSTSICSDLWSPNKKDCQKRCGICEINKKRSGNRSLQRWASRSGRGGRTTKLSSERLHSSRQTMPCCKCRCRCQNNDNRKRQKYNKQLEKQESCEDSRKDYTLMLRNLEMSIKSECPEEEPYSNDAPTTDNAVKREPISPPPDNQVDVINGLARYFSSVKVKTEVTKDTDLMGLDYSQPGRFKPSLQICDKAQDDDDASRGGTTTETPVPDDDETNKTWDTKCTVLQNTSRLKSSLMEASVSVKSTAACNSNRPGLNHDAADSKIAITSSVSLAETPINFSSSTGSQDKQIFTSSTSFATPLFLFTNQEASCGPFPAYQAANLPKYAKTCAYLPALTLNTPLSIQIGNSPGNSEYGSPPNLTENHSPGCCTSQGLYQRSTILQSSNNLYLNNKMRNSLPYVKTSGQQPQPKTLSSEIGVDLILHKDMCKTDLPTTKLPMHIPKITISTPSSLCSKGEVTPSTASPSGISHSCFISPDLPRQPLLKSISRSSSPFRSPSSLLSPYNKSPTRAVSDCHYKTSINSNFRHGSDIGSNRLKPHLACSSASRYIHGFFIPKMGNRHAHNCEDYESDDSDATLVYPPAGQEKRKLCSQANIPKRRSSVGLSSNCFSEGSCPSSLNSPSIKGDARTPSMLSPADNLDQKRSELSLMVLDLRENISKTKALKRSRRTNSFSGENQPSISEANVCFLTVTKRPSFERFMSVEPQMDSDTPYARLTQGMNCGDEDNKDFEMLRFVSGLHLQPKSRELKEASTSPGSVAETQAYGENYEHQLDYKKTLEDSRNVFTRQESKQSLHHQEACSKTANNPSCDSAIYDQSGHINNDNPAESDSDDQERPLVVIENAESDEVIEGDEAFNKMSSGTYKLPTGTMKRRRVRSLKSKAAFKKKLRISMKSLFTRKSPTKPSSVVKSNKTTRETFHKHSDKPNGSGYRSKKIPNRKIVCHVHQKNVRSRTRGEITESAHNSQDVKCDCKDGQLSEVGDVAAGRPSKRRRKQSEITPSTAGKPDSPDPIVEQLHQNSAARILQELPRYNWLEQKILQRTAYNQSPGSASSSSPHSQSSRGTINKSPTSPDVNARSKTIGTSEVALMNRDNIKSKLSRDATARSDSSSSMTKGNIPKKDVTLASQIMPELSSKTNSDESSQGNLIITTEASRDSVPSLKLDTSLLGSDDEEQDFRMNLPSPDDCNDEHNLTIDLTETEDADTVSDQVIDCVKTADPPVLQCDESFTFDASAPEDWLDRSKNTTADYNRAEVISRLSSDSTNKLQQSQPVSFSSSDKQTSLKFAAGQRSDDRLKPGDVLDESMRPILTSQPVGESSEINTPVTTTVTLTTQSLETLSQNNIKNEPGHLASSSLSEVGSETLSTTSGNTLGGNINDNSCSDTLGHGNISSGLAVLHSPSTKTTTTVTLTAASTSSSTTTTSSFKPSAPGEDVFTPLDLCLKKSESLATTNCRSKGHPPVQMVLPQIQHKLASILPQTGSVLSQFSTDVMVGGKSVLHGKQLAEELDSIQSCVSKSGIGKGQHITSLPVLGSEFKVERCYPLHADTLDLCIKTSGLTRNSASENIVDTSSHQHHLHGTETPDAIDIHENISLGLALSSEIEMGRDRDISSRLVITDEDTSVDNLSESSSIDATTSLASELLDIPVSLTSTYQAAKSMTDAELDQEFQKHLIEFKALEKLAERKAQEQMQVAIMRKRKAEMIRIMEMKKAKRDLDRVGQINSKSRDYDKTAASKSNILTFSTTTTPSSPPLPLMSVATTKSISGIVAVTDPETSSPSRPNSAVKLPLASFCQSDQSSDSARVSSDVKSVDIVITKIPSSETLTPTLIKTECRDYNENNSVVDLRFQDFNLANIKCKTESVETSCSDDIEDSTNACSYSKSVIDSSISISDEKDTFGDVQSSDHKSPRCNVGQRSDSPVCAFGKSGQPNTELRPSPPLAHQTRPVSLPIENAYNSQQNTTYTQGPYSRRNVAVNESPYVGKDIPKGETPQKAHCQRPFQTAGNLIVPLSELQGLMHGPARLPPSHHSTSGLTSRTNVHIASKSNYRPIASRPVGGEATFADPKHLERALSLSEGTESHIKLASDTSARESMQMRSQQKSLDDSDICRTAVKPVAESILKSSDEVNKVQKLFQSLSPISNRPFFPIHSGQSGTPPSLDKHIPSQRQQQQLQLQLQQPMRTTNGKFSCTNEDEEKKGAFRSPNLHPKNQIVDLTSDGLSNSEKTSSLFSQQQVHLRHSSVFEGTTSSEDPSQYSRLDPAVRRSQQFSSNTHKPVMGADLSSPFFTEFHPEKVNSLPNGFNNDRSRPGGFITHKHRLQTKEPARPVPVKDPGFFKEQLRPNMASVTQPKRYKSGALLEPHLTILAQSALSNNYHKPADDLASRFPGHIGPMVWSDEQSSVGVDCLASNPPGTWRGPSPIVSTHSGPTKETFNDVNAVNRALVEDAEKQRLRSEIYPSFHNQSDLVYKQQKQLEMDLAIAYSRPSIGTASSNPSIIPISSLHSNVSTLRQQPMIVQSFPQRSSLSSSQTHPTHNSFTRHPVQQGHFQQQQSPLCQHQSMEMTPASWRSFGNVDSSSLAANAQARPSYTQSQQLSSGQSLSSVHHETLTYQKMQQQQQQQQQQYQMHQMQQGHPTHKQMVAPSGSSPSHSLSMVQSNHTGSTLAPPQLLYGECSRSPSYSHISPTTVQPSALMMSQNRNFHTTRLSDTEHITMMHQQRQQPKVTPYDQRHRGPQHSQPMSGIPPPAAPLATLAGPPRNIVAGAYGPMVATPGHSGGPTNSMCRVCGKMAVFLCSSCRRVWYCNQQCQTKHWSVHAAECKPLS